MPLTETHWKLLCAVSALMPGAALVGYTTHEDQAPRCEVAMTADSGAQPGFTVLAERVSPACTRVELPPSQS